MARTLDEKNNSYDDELEQEPGKGKRRAEEEDKFETTDLVKRNDSDEPNYMSAKQTRIQLKTTPTRDYQWVREHQITDARRRPKE